MKRALITQRASVDSHGQNIDVLEAAYTEFFSARGFHLLPVSNFLPLSGDAADMKADILILTGGGDVTEKYGGHIKVDAGGAEIARDHTCTALIKRSLEACVPILAICYGMQLLNCHFGGFLVSDTYSTQTPPRQPGNEHTVNISIPAETLRHPEINGVHSVNHYHSTTVNSESLAPDLLSIARDADYDSIEAFIHKELPVAGMMWHPERPAPEPRFNDHFVETMLNILMGND